MPLSPFFSSFFCIYRFEGKESFVELLKNKTRVIEIINALLPGTYALYQRSFQDINLEDIRKYLKVDDKHVFVGKEVDELLKNADRPAWDVFWILDTYIDYPGNEPIYPYNLY